MFILLDNALFYIYFIYGVSFIVMAGFILMGIRQATAVTFISSFSILAACGFVHGTTEFVDWVRFIRHEIDLPESAVLLYISQLCLIFSFLFLLQFSVNMLTYKNSQRKSPRAIPLVSACVFVAVLNVLRISDIREAGLISRYSFGFAGSALSAVAFFRLSKAFKPLGNVKLNRGIIFMAAGFAAYAICGGLVVTPFFGIPVQVFRTACAFTIAAASASILEVFKVRD